MKKMKKNPNPLPPAYRQLQTRLSRIGWIALGSLVERLAPGHGGPRYQWSRRVAGKTVTVALSAEQFAWMQQALANQREVWDILADMQRVSLQHMWKTIPSAKHHNRLSDRVLGVI